jgi:zinc transport system permease protein
MGSLSMRCIIIAINMIHDFLSAWSWLLPALMVCILVSVASALMGSFVVARKMNNAAGGIAHIVLGGAGIAFYFGLPLLMGSFAVAILGAMIIGAVSTRLPAQEEVVINALWAFSMSMGIILISMSGVSSVDFSSYLFGNVLLTSPSDVWVLSGVIGLLIAVMAVAWRALLAVSFDGEYAKTRGLPVFWINQLLLVLTALTVVALVRVVGIVFVIALLTIPVAIAQLFVYTLKGWMLWAMGINLVACVFGLAMAYFVDLPAGASVVALLSVAYLLSVAIAKPR